MSELLKQDHEALRCVMNDFAHTMRTQGVAGLPDIARKRIAFSALFREHLAREYEQGLSLQNSGVAAQAAPLLREHGDAIRALFLQYSDHIKYWTPAEISLDWSGYVDATLALQQRLFERMDWEERHLHPLMDALPY